MEPEKPDAHLRNALQILYLLLAGAPEDQEIIQVERASLLGVIGRIEAARIRAPFPTTEKPYGGL